MIMITQRHQFLSYLLKGVEILVTPKASVFVRQGIINFLA
jgi:hypothetical protein